MLKGLVSVLGNMPNAVIYQSICLFALFGFFHLALLVPVATHAFDMTGYPLLQVTVFTSKGLQVIQKSAKI